MTSRFVADDPLTRRIRALAEPACASCGVDCYLVQLQHGYKKGTKVQVFIDAIGGVDIDDCSKVSRQLSAVLDVEDPIEGSFFLEVSSPGLDRPLRDTADLQTVIGQTVHLETDKPIDGRRRFSGEIAAADEQTVTLKVDGRTWQVPAESIKKASLQYSFNKDHT